MRSTAPSLPELTRLHLALSDEERLTLLEELLVACSHGWPQVEAVLDCYVLDHEVRETLDRLPDGIHRTEPYTEGNQDGLDA